MNRIPIGLALVVAALLLSLVGGCSVWAWMQWASLEVESPGLVWALRVAVFAVPATLASATGALGLLGAYNRWARWQVVQANKTIELTRAQVQIAPMATSFTLHDSHQQLLPEAGEPTEPGIDVGPLPPDQWLAWLDQQPHALFAASTKKGKSTMAKYGLKPRLEAGEPIFVIDPHSSDWFKLPVVGGGENWTLIEVALMAVYAEYKSRIGYREEYRRKTGDELPHTYFPRLTVLFDEVNMARTAFSRIYAGTRRHEDPWPLFAECLGSGARKVGISIWLLAQSALVEDIGLSGSMRENFTRIALDEPTIQRMIRGEKRERKIAIDDALSGMSFPAAASIDADVFLLDRRGIREVSPPRTATPWDGWDYEHDMVRRTATPTQQLAPPSEQAVITMPASLIPVTIGEVRTSAVIAHLLKREKPPHEIAALVESLVHRVAPGQDRGEVEAEIARRAERFAANGAVEALAASLDHAALARTCMAVGAGRNMAFAILGGNRKIFNALMQQVASSGPMVPQS